MTRKTTRNDIKGQEMTRIKNMLKHAKKKKTVPEEKKAISRTAAGARSQKMKSCVLLEKQSGQK